MTNPWAARAMPGPAGMHPYQPGKPVEELERELGITGAVKLASNENPRGPGPAVHAAIERAATELSRYPDGAGFALRAAIAEHLGVAADGVTLGNGSNDVLELIARVFLGPGTSAVVSAHAFVVYPLAVRAVGAELIEVPATTGLGHDLPAMAAAVRDDTRVVFVANPNNPTGTFAPRGDIEAFLAAVPEHVLVVLDEAYCEYVAGDADAADGVALLAAHPNLVVSRTFSKIHGLAALRVGYTVSSAAIADLLNRLRQPFNVNSLAQAAAIAALGDADFVAESRRLNDEGLAAVSRGLEALGLSCVPSRANFVTVDLGRPAAPVYEALLREGVIVRPVANYGLPNHLRVSIGLPEENQRCLDAFASVLGAAG